MQISVTLFTESTEMATDQPVAITLRYWGTDCVTPSIGAMRDPRARSRVRRHSRLTRVELMPTVSPTASRNRKKLPAL